VKARFGARKEDEYKLFLMVRLTFVEQEVGWQGGRGGGREGLLASISFSILMRCFSTN